MSTTLPHNILVYLLMWPLQGCRVPFIHRVQRHVIVFVELALHAVLLTSSTVIGAYNDIQ